MNDIRLAKIEDFDDIWPILKAVFEAGETYPQASKMSKGAAFRYWIQTPTATYVALEAGGVVGTYYLRPNQPDRGAHVCNAGYMVASGARNRGIGTAMGRHSLIEAKALGFMAMQFNLVVATNAPSIRIRKKLGFEVAGTLPGAFNHKTPGFVDAFVMYRPL